MGGGQEVAQMRHCQAGQVPRVERVNEVESELGLIGHTYFV